MVGPLPPSGVGCSDWMGAQRDSWVPVTWYWLYVCVWFRRIQLAECALFCMCIIFEKKKKSL